MRLSDYEIEEAPLDQIEKWWKELYADEPPFVVLKESESPRLHIVIETDDVNWAEKAKDRPINVKLIRLDGPGYHEGQGTTLNEALLRAALKTFRPDTNKKGESITAP